MWPKISVIISVRPGALVYSMAALQAAHYPRERLEILVVKGNCLPRQRNEAARKASGDVLYFLDDDSLVASDVLERLAAHYGDPDVHVVGGPSLTPEDEPLLSRCIGYALETRLGAWTMRARYAPVGVYRAATEKELIGCNLSIRRQALEAIGGFCEDMFPNDETELIGRLQHHGHRVMYDPALIVRRAQRRSWRSLVRQFFTYGQGRLRQIRRTPTARVTPFLVPALGLVYLALLPLLLWELGPWIMLPLATYLATILLSSVWLGLANRAVAGCVILPIVFGLIHVSYGCGLIYESLVHRLRRQARTTPETVVVSRV